MTCSLCGSAYHTRSKCPWEKEMTNNELLEILKRAEAVKAELIRRIVEYEKVYGKLPDNIETKENYGNDQI